MAERVGASQDTGRFHRSLFMRSEGHILMAGIGLLLACIIWAGINLLWSPEYCRKILSLAATRFIVGRPGGVYFGHVLEVSYGVNISVNLLVDVIAVFFIYPLFVFSVEDIFILHSLKNFINRMHKTARTNYKIIKIYGIPGLFLFVLFPLWGTGPVVGSVIGYMMGLPPWFNMSVVLGATLLAVVIWAVILAEFHVHLLAFGVYIPLIVIMILFVFTIGVHLVRDLRHKN